MGSIRDDYIHHVGVTTTHRTYNNGETTTHYLWKGTSAQIAERLAKSVKSQLDYGETRRIELTPINPAFVSDLSVEP